MANQQITIDLETGKFGAIYADALRPYFDALGQSVTQRASDVEPDGDGWSASIREWVPNGTVVLGPFPTRAEALAAEVEYLERVL